MTHADSADTVIAAPPQSVFAALTDAGARAAWLPPTGMTGRFEWFDARTGGGYRMVLEHDDTSVLGKSEQNRDIAEVRFAAVEPPRRVVEEVDFVSDDPLFTGTMTMTWSVEAIGTGTRVTVTATDVPDGITSEDHTAAFASTLANLDGYVRSRGSAPAG